MSSQDLSISNEVIVECVLSKEAHSIFFVGIDGSLGGDPVLSRLSTVKNCFCYFKACRPFMILTG